MPETKPFPKMYRHGPPNVNRPFIEDRKSPGGSGHLASYEILKRDLRRLFEFIEPVVANEDAFSHRTFELLLRACTEVESNFKEVAAANNHHDFHNMKRYSDLEDPMKLSSYEVRCVAADFAAFSPFASFTHAVREQRSPKWYRAYNHVKHHRADKFAEATLECVVHALGGLHVLLLAQYGPSLDSRMTMSPEGFPQQAHDLFSAIAEPSWSELERYEFDWEALKTQPNRYQQHPVPLRP